MTRPLNQIARISTTLAPLAVNRQGQFPSVTLSFNLAPGVAIGEAAAAVQRATASLHRPGSTATLMLFGRPPDVIGIILLIGSVKRTAAARPACFGSGPSR